MAWTMGWLGSLVAAWLATLLASMALDLRASPRVAPWRARGVRPVVLHLATVSWLFVLFMALWGRAWFALAGALGLFALLVVVNNAKFKALREPVVFSDLALFAQSLRHPRLYFPYLSWLQAAAAVPAVALFATAFGLDAWRYPVAAEVWWLLCLVLFGLQVGLVQGMRVTLDPERDQGTWGFFCVFVSYLVKGLSPRELRQVQAQFKASPYAQVQVRTSRKSAPDKADAPDVLVVQSESFFDIRKTGLALQPGLLAHFDSLRQSGLGAGELSVPAWGANTMRTEHAFLSGLPNAALRYARFYPYAFVRGSTPALPQAFKARAYACTAVHPYASEFFFRHKVFPRLGFDAFVDRAHFADAAYAGPYVSDAAVTDCLIERLEQASGQAQFIFAITMENHGPLHLEKATAQEALALYQRPDGQAIDDLTVYVRHLAHADQMLGRLQAYLAQRQRKTVLCFYGDHVPGMGAVYDRLGANPLHSDYLLWSNFEMANRPGLARDAQCLTPEQLGLRLACLAGVL